ncbi:MAG: ATP-binding cassette domain-containing protein [Slackia sp.]|nr:ATP-binding cassette domain-containing protein [Slackia sp.]
MLEAHDLEFSYGAAPIIAGFDIGIAPGERVAVSAPSGRGKTTLCQLLAGYLRPQCGSVTLDGAPLPTGGPAPVQMIWQHPERMLDPLLTMEKSLAECPCDAETLGELREAIGVRDAWLTRRPRELSGGELQRVCIVRALACNPRYLICDEISTMLDALTQADIWARLMAWSDERGAGMAVVSHSPALTARVATRTVEL